MYKGMMFVSPIMTAIQGGVVSCSQTTGLVLSATGSFHTSRIVHASSAF